MELNPTNAVPIDLNIKPQYQMEFTLEPPTKPSTWDEILNESPMFFFINHDDEGNIKGLTPII